jgi:hypothetical protein
MSQPLETTHLPADRGLNGLGLIMQIGGSMYAALTAMIGLTQIIVISEMESRSRGWGGESQSSGLTFWFFLLMGSGVARSLAHRAAGTELLYGSQPANAIRRYLLVSIFQIGVWLAFFLVKLDAPMSAWLPITLVLTAWPLTVFLVTSRPGVLPAADEHGFARLPATGDRGFEGMSVLMVLFGLAGALYTGLMLLAMLEVPSRARNGSFTLLMAATAFLLVRSLAHAHAGASLLGELSLDRADSLVGRYINLGVISSLSFGGAMMILFGAMPGGGMMMIMPMVIGITLLLLAWPLAVRQLLVTRRMELYGEPGGAPQLFGAPDQGRTTLGWFLLAMGVLAFAAALPAVVFSSDADKAAVEGVGEMFGGMTGGSASRVPLLGLGVAGLQVWAALELLWMTPRHKQIATVYGAAAIGVTLYDLMPMFDALDKLGLKAIGSGGGNTMMMAALALALITPLITLVLVNRNLPPPRPTAGIANVFG